MYLFDAHLDLSMNAIDWNRDLRLPLAELNAREQGMEDKAGRGMATVNFESMRQGKIGLCAATLIARYVKSDNPLPGWQSPEQAWSHVQGQLCWYREMERTGDLTCIRTKKDLKKAMARCKKGVGSDHAIGYVLSLEGADSIVSMDHLEMLYHSGLRAVGPAHYGPGTYAHGTDSEGGLGKLGLLLLDKMQELNMILDVTHLCETSFWEAMEHYTGPIWASHSNCRKIVPHHRQFDDAQIKALLERRAVIGVVLDVWMMAPAWVKGESNLIDTPVTLDQLVDHIVHLCHLAGNTEQVGVGSDLDGGFGRDQCPVEINSIADLQRLGSALSDRRFTDGEIAQIFHRNWESFLLQAWDN